MRISEQAKQETRTRILAKSAELFICQGFDETTTRDIAKATGIATGTLFNYFPSKETLAMHLVAEQLDAGAADYLQRRTQDESLTEDLFLFIASGLRRLKPMHSFLGPVFEKSLSPFPRKAACPEGEATRQKHLSCIQEIIIRHGFSVAPDYVAINLYWSLFLGILAFWVNDTSPNQQKSQTLIDYTLQVFVQSISGPETDTGAACVK